MHGNPPETSDVGLRVSSQTSKKLGLGMAPTTLSLGIDKCSGLA